MRLAATRSPVASLTSSAKARSAASVPHRARSRATRWVTSGRIASGVDRKVAISACSRPTPAVSTPDRDRVHSSIASTRAILDPAGGAESRIGRPTTTAGTSSAATNHPVSSAVSKPALTPASNSARVRGDVPPSRAAKGSRIRVGAGGLCGDLRSPVATPIRPATTRAPPSPGIRAVMLRPHAAGPQPGTRAGRTRTAQGPGTHPAAPQRRRAARMTAGTPASSRIPSPAPPARRR